MTTLTRPSRSTIAFLTVLGAALLAVFFFGPEYLLRHRYPNYGSPDRMRDALDNSVVQFWRNDIRDLPPELAHIVEYWREWHAIKIVISVLLVLVFALLAITLWRAFLVAAAIRTGGPAFLATVLTVSAVILVSVNVQATVAPMVALLPIVSDDAGTAAVAPTLAEISRAVDQHSNSPALAVLVEQVGRYHWTLAVFTAVGAAVFVVASVVAFTRRRSADRTHRIMYANLGGVGIVATMVMVLMLTVSAVAVADRSRALLDILGA